MCSKEKNDLKDLLSGDSKIPDVDYKSFVKRMIIENGEFSKDNKSKIVETIDDWFKFDKAISWNTIRRELNKKSSSKTKMKYLQQCLKVNGDILQNNEQLYKDIKSGRGGFVDEKFYLDYRESLYCVINNIITEIEYLKKNPIKYKSRDKIVWKKTQSQNILYNIIDGLKNDYIDLMGDEIEVFINYHFSDWEGKPLFPGHKTFSERIVGIMWIDILPSLIDFVALLYQYDLIVIPSNPGKKNEVQYKKFISENFFDKTYNPVNDGSIETLISNDGLRKDKDEIVLLVFKSLELD